LQETRSKVCFSSSASSENEVEAQKEATAGHIESGHLRDLSLADDRIFVMEREAGSAVHERVVAVAERQGVDVTKVAASATTE